MAFRIPYRNYALSSASILYRPDSQHIAAFAAKPTWWTKDFEPITGPDLNDINPNTPFSTKLVPFALRLCHETYFMRGGVEAVFDDIPKPIGLMRFAPRRAAKGSMFTARQRAAATNTTGFADRPAPAPVVTEGDLGKLPELRRRND